MREVGIWRDAAAIGRFGLLHLAALAVLLSMVGCALSVSLGGGNTPESPERKPPAAAARSQTL